MAFSVAGLTEYVNMNGKELLFHAINKGKTTSIVDVIPDIKHSKMLNFVGSTIYAVAGGCGYTTSGTTTLSEVQLTVCPIKINDTLCPEDLNSKSLSMAMKAGSYQHSLPLEAQFANEKAASIAQMIESMIWLGDTATGTGNNSLCNGIKQKLTLTSISSTTVSMGTSAFTTSTAVAVINAMVVALDANVLNENDLTLFMGLGDFNIYVQALIAEKYLTFDATKPQTEYEIFVPGFNVKVVGTYGISAASNFMYLTPASNIAIGTDLLNDYERFEFIDAKENDEIRFICKFKIGVAIKKGAFGVYQALS